MLNNLLSRERESIIFRIKYLENQLDQLPKGRIFCSKNGNGIKWYQSNGRKPIYIPKSDRTYAEQLALRGYYELCLEEENEQLHVLDDLLGKIYQSESPAEGVSQSEKYLNAPGFQELLASYFLNCSNSSKDIKTWKEAEYVKNISYPEHLIHPIYAGELVRSKSEVIIANTLYQYKIPYRYECELKLGSVKCYPDFTILHPKTRKIYYWEHFGLMGDESYRDGAFSKMKLYGNYNILPSINLITTYENKANPLKSTKVESIIGEYFGVLCS